MFIAVATFITGIESVERQMLLLAVPLGFHLKMSCICGVCFRSVRLKVEITNFTRRPAVSAIQGGAETIERGQLSM